MIDSRCIKVLAYCFLDIMLLTVGYVLNSFILINFAIAGFCFILLFSNIEYFLAIMLFYLPWSPVLKYAPGTNTFYSLIIAAVFLKLLLPRRIAKDDVKIPVFIIFITLVFTLIGTATKLVLNFPIDGPYMKFIFMLFFIALYVKNDTNSLRFEILVLFFCSGIISSCIASQMLMEYPYMLAYIDVYDIEKGIVRLSGFYGDANFYSSQILAAIAGIMMVLYRTNNRKSELIQIVAIAILVVFGMYSVSKMFILCMVTMFSLYSVILFSRKKNVLRNISTTVTVLLIISIIYTTNIFSTQIDYYLYRFSDIDNNNDLTTGRSGIWLAYFQYFNSELNWLFFGEALTSNSYVIGRASHNTLIQLIFQCGIVGSTFLVLYWKAIMKIILSNKLSYEPFNILVALIGCFGPWFALDMLFFDQFFYITLFFIYLLKYLSTNKIVARGDKT